ncbi:MAG: hypothetical protein F7C34_03730 [Desulfurococcales archaeon]|nr:hypothetical protein [Desulfurococcales archaeon]
MTNNDTRVFLYTILKLQWGYIVRQPGATAAQAAYILPPPTTVVGAYANPLARILGVPDYAERRRGGLPVRNKYMECLLASTLAAGAGLVGLGAIRVGAVTYEEPARIMGTPYKSGGSYQKAVKQPIYLSATELLPVQAAGAASAPGAVMAMAWLLDASRLEGCLRRSVSTGDLERAAWGVYRLGSREGLAHPVEAGAIAGGALDEKDRGFYKSLLYQDSLCASREEGYTVQAALLGLDYRERVYLVPSGLLGGANILTPPERAPTFYLRPGCRAAGASVGGRGLELRLAYRG